METWLLLTAYKKSPVPYPMVSSPTPYDLPFNHNTARLAYYCAMTLEGQPKSILTCHLKANIRLLISDQY